MSHYHHLTIIERENLFKYQIEGCGIREIARRLDRSPSTISRELRRNDTEYRPSTAQKSYEHRRKNSVRKYRLSDLDLNMEVRFYLASFYWSPEQISQRMKLEKGKSVVGTSTIYRALDSGLIRDTARYYLRRKYKTHGKSTRKKSQCFGKCITERPSQAGERSQLGHWEGDTVQGKAAERCRLVTLVDRMSRYTLISKVETPEASVVSEAVASMLKGLTAHTLLPSTGEKSLLSPVT